MMDEFERLVLSKFPDFPGYRTGEISDEAAQQWYSAYQHLVEWLHERRIAEQPRVSVKV